MAKQVLADLLVAGGLVYLSGAWHRVNISVSDGKIDGILSPGQNPNADKVIDATGLLVAPGLIDSHVHFMDPPDRGEANEDFETGTEAAAAGGVTMVGDMPTNTPVITSETAFRNKVERISPKAVVDFALWGGATNIEQIPHLLEAGAVGIKMWTVAGRNGQELATSEDSVIFTVMRTLSSLQGVILVHPSSQRIYEKCKEESARQGSTDALLRNYWRDGQFISERVSVATLLALSGFLRLPLHIAHVRSRAVLDLVEHARAQGQRVTLELNPKYLFLTSVNNPLLRNTNIARGLTPEQAEYLWDRVLDGTIDVIATDHGPGKPESTSEYIKDDCTWACGLVYPSGPQIEDYFSLLLDRAGGDPSAISAIIRCCSENPARVLRVFPQKGAISIGSDADLTIFDPKREFTISPEKMYTKLRWTIYAGRRVRGKAVKTIVGGALVMEDGVVIGKPGSGKLIKGSLTKAS